MNRIILITIFQLFALVSNATLVNRYKLTVSTSTYNDLPAIGGSYNLTDWNRAIFGIPFYGFGSPVNSPYANNYGVVSWSFATSGETFIVRALGSELVSASFYGYAKQYMQSVIEGASPNRIMKVEYHMMNFYHEIPNIVSTISFQIWFFEKDESIEIHYGPLNWVSGDELSDYCYASVLKCTGYGNSCGGYELYGNNTSPSIDSSTFYTTSYNPMNLKYVPWEGLIYRFSPYVGSSTGVSSPNVIIADFLANYNPINKYFNVIAPDGEQIKDVAVYDLSGRMVSKATIQETNQAKIDCSSFPAAMYLVKIVTTNRVFTTKFSKP